MTVLDLESVMAPGTMNNVVDNDPNSSFPLAVEHLLNLLSTSRLIDFNHAYTTGQVASLEEKTHSTLRRLDCFIYHQAQVLRSAIRTCNIVTPEITNMLIVILRETYPTSDFCLSVRYAVSKPLLRDTYPVFCPYRIADLLVRLPSRSPDEPLMPPPILHEEHSYSTPSFVPRLFHNGSPLVAGELDRYAVLNKTNSDSGAHGENNDMENTVSDGAESNGAKMDEDINTETAEDDDCEAFEVEDNEDEDDDEDDNASQVDIAEEEGIKGNDRQLIISADDDEIQEGTLVCVGLVEDIAALLTSALYHRHVNGMGGPLVGLAYAKTSPEVHVVIAWLDQYIDDGNDLPGVHLYYGPEITCFDLSQPVDALGLASFLADTRNALLKNKFWTRKHQPIPWRADLHSSFRGDSFAIDKSIDSNANISKWINALHRTFPGGSGAKSITSLDPHEETTGDYERVARVQRQSCTTARDMTETSGAAPSEMPQSKSGPPKTDKSQKSSSSTKDASDAKTKATSASNLSASAFVKRSAERGTTENMVVEKRVRAYFVQRKVVSVSVQVPRSIGTLKYLLPRQYKACTALQWLHVSPTCDIIERPMTCSHIESLMGELFAEAERCDSNNSFLGEMHPNVEKVVWTGLCSILHVVAAARNIDAARYIGSISGITDERSAARIAVNEATFRHQWDQIALTMVNLCNADFVSFEREVTLRYPAHPKDSLTGETSFWELHSDISAFWASVHDFGPSAEALHDFTDWFEVSDPCKSDLSREPISGKSDSIISLTIPNVFRRNKQANAANIWNLTFEPAANTSSGDTVSSPPPGHGGLFEARPRRVYGENEKERHRKSIPTDTPSPTGTPIATNTPSPTNAPSPTGSPIATDAPSPTAAPIATNTPNPTNALSPTGSPIATEAPSPTGSPIATDTPSRTGTSIATATISPTGAPSPTGTFIATDAPSPTDAPTPTNTPIATDIPIPTATPIPTDTSVPAKIPSPAPICLDGVSNDSTPSQQKQAIQRGLRIPLMADEYKHDLKPKDVSKEAAADQSRLYLVAILKFLSLFNIGNLPIFGLTTSGSRGIVSCGWMERREVADKPLAFHEVTFVAEKDIRPLDITKPMDAMNFAMIVAYIVLIQAPRFRLLFANVDSVDMLDESVKSFLLHPKKMAPFRLAREQAKKEKWCKVKTATGKKGKNAAAEVHSNLDNIVEEAGDR